MHTKPLALDQVPDELRQGKCSECHDMQDTQSCGCHVLFQDARLRARTELRPCVGCHRETWTGNAASIPGADVCGSCHGDKLLTDSAEEKRLRGYLQRGEGIRWVQLTTIDPHVLFSHKAHVRDAGVGCLRCHDEMRDLMSPPKTAAVFSMVGCMRCHTQNHASNDCLTCHK